MRLGSGSCMRLGSADFAILLPQLPPQGTPSVAGPPLLSIPGAGLPAPPSILPVQVAAHLLKEAPENKLTIGELEAEARRHYPYYSSSNGTPELRQAWRQALEAALREHPTTFTCRPRAANEPGAGAVWQLNV